MKKEFICSLGNMAFTRQVDRNGSVFVGKKTCWIWREVQEQLPGGLCAASLISFLCCQFLGRVGAPALVLMSPALQKSSPAEQEGQSEIWQLCTNVDPWRVCSLGDCTCLIF